MSPISVHWLYLIHFLPGSMLIKKGLSLMRFKSEVEFPTLQAFMNGESSESPIGEIGGRGRGRFIAT